MADLTKILNGPWQDAGDDRFEWVAVDDEENGRVMIMSFGIGLGLAIAPKQVVCVEWLVA
jgi:hypothetical protein